MTLWRQNSLSGMLEWIQWNTRYISLCFLFLIVFDMLQIEVSQITCIVVDFGKLIDCVSMIVINNFFWKLVSDGM